MTDKMARTFPTAYKLKAIKRAEGGEGVLPVALGIWRKLLHDWIKAWKADGPAGLNRKRGPKPGPRKLRPLTKPADKGSSGELGITVTVHLTSVIVSCTVTVIPDQSTIIRMESSSIGKTRLRGARALAP
jgi:hypothetical protein